MSVLRPADILIPKIKDFTKWSVVACDQFTSESEYWTTLKELVGKEYSTLNLVYPEIYLEDNTKERIKLINDNMVKYLEDGVFDEYKNCFILTVRDTKYVKNRVGLIGVVDLEEYSFEFEKKPFIRPTEATVKERIPPRIEIRKNAVLEFPHVMLLVDDEEENVIEDLFKKKEELKKIYDSDLNMDGGHIAGYLIEDTAPVLEKFESLLNKDRLVKKYGKEERLLFAVGDGNHSLATAKVMWESIKPTLTKEEQETSKARFALVEICNVYQEAIYFEPIFRFVTGIDKDAFLKGLESINFGKVTLYDGEETVYNNDLSVPETIINVDEYIKDFILNNGGKVDYIHGVENVKNLVDKFGGVGIIFDKFDKNSLFKYIIDKGILPKKTFSMGEGIEKRYYLEGRRIK
ncbi:MAG: DUF1015 domain-containing protein [Clostridiales bacterium]|nr:DUF1015 domain-containing protein [Clostridiales bacterium]